MLFPRKDEVLEIHAKLLEQFGGLPGIRDEGSLDSALMAAAQRQHYEAAGLATCAATYAFHLTQNHPGPSAKHQPPQGARAALPGSPEALFLFAPLVEEGVGGEGAADPARNDESSNLSPSSPRGEGRKEPL